MVKSLSLVTGVGPSSARETVAGFKWITLCSSATDGQANRAIM